MRPAPSAGRRARTRVLSCSLSLATIVATVGPIVDPSMAVAQKFSKSANVRCTVAPRFSAFQRCRAPHPSTSFEGHRSLKRQSGAGEREQSPWRAIQLELVAEEIRRAVEVKMKVLGGGESKQTYYACVPDKLGAEDAVRKRINATDDVIVTAGNLVLASVFEAMNVKLGDVSQWDMMPKGLRGHLRLTADSTSHSRSAV